MKAPVKSGTRKPGTRASRTRGQGAAYQAAVEAVFAILVAGGAGWWADRHFETSPLYLLIGLVIGFGSFVLRLWRLGREFADAPGAPGPDSPDGPDRCPDENRD